MKKTTWAFLLVMLFAAAGHGGEEKGRKELFRIPRDGKWGYMDRSGKVVMEPAYDQVLSFSDGLAGVNRGGGCPVARVPRSRGADGGSSTGRVRSSSRHGSISSGSSKMGSRPSMWEG
jgi:hypothetical protein